MVKVKSQNFFVKIALCYFGLIKSINDKEYEKAGSTTQYNKRNANTPFFNIGRAKATSDTQNMNIQECDYLNLVNNKEDNRQTTALYNEDIEIVDEEECLIFTTNNKKPTIVSDNEYSTNLNEKTNTKALYTVNEDLRKIGLDHAQANLDITNIDEPMEEQSTSAITGMNNTNSTFVPITNQPIKTPTENKFTTSTPGNYEYIVTHNRSNENECVFVDIKYEKVCANPKTSNFYLDQNRKLCFRAAKPYSVYERRIYTKYTPTEQQRTNEYAVKQTMEKAKRREERRLAEEKLARCGSPVAVHGTRAANIQDDESESTDKDKNNKEHGTNAEKNLEDNPELTDREKIRRERQIYAAALKAEKRRQLANNNNTSFSSKDCPDCDMCCCFCYM